MFCNKKPKSDLPGIKSNDGSPNLSIGEKIGRWDISKSNLTKIFGLAGLLLIVIFILACFNGSSNWTDRLIGTVGGLASIFGIYLTLCQLIETKKDVVIVGAIADATRIASEETRQSLRMTLSVASVAKYCEQIKLIQEKLNNKELKFVIHLIHELQEAILELQKYLKSVNIPFDEKSVADHIKKMGMNISFIRSAIDRHNEKYKRTEILKDFDDLLILMSDLKAKLTTYDNGQPQITV